MNRITYQDKRKGSQWTSGDANEIKNVVNALVDTLEDTEIVDVTIDEMEAIYNE